MDTPTENIYFKKEHLLQQNLEIPLKLLKNKKLSSDVKLIIQFLITNRDDNDIEATSRLSISNNLGISLNKVKEIMSNMVLVYKFIICTSSYTYVIDTEVLYEYLNRTNKRPRIITNDLNLELFNKVDEILKNWPYKKQIKIQKISEMVNATAFDIRANYPNFNNVVKHINKVLKPKKIILDEDGNNMNTKNYIKQNREQI